MNRQEFELTAKKFRAGKMTLSAFANAYVAAVEGRPIDERDDLANPSVGPCEKTAITLGCDESVRRSSLADFAADAACERSFKLASLVDASEHSLTEAVELVKDSQTAQRPLLLVRVNDAIGKELSHRFPSGIYDSRGGTFRLSKFQVAVPRGSVSIFLDDSCEHHNVHEITDTLSWLGISFNVHQISKSFEGSEGNFQNSDKSIPEVSIVLAGVNSKLPIWVAQAWPGSVRLVLYNRAGNRGGNKLYVERGKSIPTSQPVLINIPGGFWAAYLASCFIH